MNCRPEDGGSRRFYNVGQLLPDFAAQQPRNFMCSVMHTSCGNCVLCCPWRDGLAWRRRPLSDWTLILCWYSPISLRGQQARLPACKSVTLNTMTCLPCLFVIVWSRSSSLFTIIVNAEVAHKSLILHRPSHMCYRNFFSQVYVGQNRVFVQQSTGMQPSCKLFRHFYSLLHSLLRTQE